LEKNKDYYKINKIYNNVINPILWQLGHINMFYIKYVINLGKDSYYRTSQSIEDVLYGNKYGKATLK
jgi:subtilase family serine protease